RPRRNERRTACRNHYESGEAHAPASASGGRGGKRRDLLHAYGRGRREPAQVHRRERARREEPRRVRLLVFAVKEHSKIVGKNAESNQALWDRLERAETLAAIRQSMEELKRGEGVAVKKAEARLRREHGFAR